MCIYTHIYIHPRVHMHILTPFPPKLWQVQEERLAREDYREDSKQRDKMLLANSSKAVTAVITTASSTTTIAKNERVESAEMQPEKYIKGDQLSMAASASGPESNAERQKTEKRSKSAKSKKEKKSKSRKEKKSKSKKKDKDKTKAVRIVSSTSSTPTQVATIED